MISWSEFESMDWLVVKNIVLAKRKYNEKLAEAMNNVRNKK